MGPPDVLVIAVSQRSATVRQVSSAPWGFAGYTTDGRAVVYTLSPRKVDDAVTCTLGHEVMHIALGAYHR